MAIQLNDPVEFSPEKDDILNSAQRIETLVHRTPVLSSVSINKLLGCKIFFKCENFQKVGAFKFRGACNAVFSLSEMELENGISTHSSGNHAAAVSLAGSLRGTKVYIVMPVSASDIKIKAVQNYGGEIIFCDPDPKTRELVHDQLRKEKGCVFIHPSDDPRVILGQSTSAKEFFEETKDIDFLISPVGGGGILSGTCISAHFFSPRTKVIGAEPEGADDAFRSIRDGKIYPSINPLTIADGLLTSLGPNTFKIISKYVSRIITVKEESIISAMKMIWERMKIIVEPSAAVGLASVIENKEFFHSKKVGIILTGGNVDLDKLPWIR